MDFYSKNHFIMNTKFSLVLDYIPRTTNTTDNVGINLALNQTINSGKY